MNKLRLIKIYELKGKVHPIEQYVIDLLDGHVKYEFEYTIDYNRNGFVYIRLYLKSGNIWIFNSQSIKYKDDEVFKYLLEKHLNIEIKDVCYA